MQDLKGKRVAFLATDGVEQVELERPLEAVREAGAETTLVSLKAGPFQGFNHLDKGKTFVADQAVGDVRAEDFDALVLPGGVANPDQLRTNDDGGRLRAHLRRRRQAGRRHLPRAVAAGRGRRRPRAHR